MKALHVEGEKDAAAVTWLERGRHQDGVET
jgi:hypothetical protein